ncbi:hypothetical protein [Clostridium perfringens]|uniref:hypothetical protein n=1 Tax=Clostridium perfringens TaxID=1502 RepID=UPI0034A4EA03
MYQRIHIYKKEYQNLIRLEPTNKSNQISLDIKINWNFNEVITGGSGDKTWAEDTAIEGMIGSLKYRTVVETEENGGNRVVEIDKNKSEKSKYGNSWVNDKNENKTNKNDSLSKQNT